MSRATRVFAANWKMNYGPREARVFVERFLSLYPPLADRRVLLFPPAVSLEATSEAVRSRADVATGAQNVWTERKGAFTGETSAPMAREAGGRYVLVGHSERRHVFHETNAETAAKCAVVVESGLVPLLCVGETLEQRERGDAMVTVVEQLRAGVHRLTAEEVSRVIIAYEPVWAIGTGKTATPPDASPVHATIRSTLSEITQGRAETIPILYGGSVHAGNAAALLGADGIDGLLVGGASLDPETWAAICGV